MSKRYMDFVPAGSSPRKVVREDSSAGKRVSTPAKSAMPRMESRRRPVSYNDAMESRRVDAPKSQEPVYGVIEDLQPKFVKTDVKKRPLGRKTEQPAPATKSAARPSQKTVQKSAQRTVTRNSRAVSSRGESRESSEDIFNDALKVAEGAFADRDREVQKSTAINKTPFVNTEKVAKRPLSKNVRQKKIIEPKEEPSKTVTIITKEKKDSKIGIIVAVILTIILGATAGTVAFLLLPK